MIQDKGKKARSEIDMLHGSIADKLVLFALPLALTGVFQQLFNSADVAVLGQFAGKNAMAAVGNNTPIIGLLVSLFMGLSLGANVVIAQCIGGKKLAKARQAVHTAFLLAVVSGILMMAVSEILMGQLMELLAVPAEVEAMAEMYLRIYLLGIPAMAVYNFEAAIFRSCGDTRLPLISLIISSLLNIVLNLLFVIVFGMAIEGVALATVIANFVSAAILWHQLCHHANETLRLDMHQLHWHIDELKRIIRIGLPAGMQGMIFCLSNLLIQSAINALGADAMAASVAAFIIEVNVYCVINAFGQSVTTFIGQNYGAGNIKRCFQVVKIALLVETGCMVLICGLCVYFDEPLLLIFNDDKTVIELGIIRILYVTAPQLINGVIEILSGAMRGFGFSLPPALLVLFSICGMRVLWVYTVFAAQPDFAVLMLNYPVSWLITAVLLTAIYQFYRHQIKRYKMAVQF